MTTIISEDHSASTFWGEGGDSMFLQNIGNHLPDYVVS
jgi:hypothetical protein